jgi:hypothetical protein
MCKDDGAFNNENSQRFFDSLADMRMRVWLCVAALSRALDGAISIRNLPAEINNLI